MGRFIKLCRRLYAAVIRFVAGPPVFPPLDPVLPDPEPAEDPGLLKDEESGEQRIASICKHLFRLYAGAKNLDTEQMSRVKIQDFVPWCLDHRDCWYSDKAKPGIVAGLCVQEGDVEAIWTMFQNPYNAMALLLPFWPMLTLSGLPPVKHVPDLINVSIGMGWGVGSTDERALQLQAPVQWKPGAPATNGFICSLLKEICDGMIQTFAENGIDALYEKHAVRTGTPDAAAKPRPLPPRQHPPGASGL